MINMLPTTGLQTAPFGPAMPGEKNDPVDLYADLFAALFTVPPPVKLVEPPTTVKPNEDLNFTGNGEKNVGSDNPFTEMFGETPFAPLSPDNKAGVVAEKRDAHPVFSQPSLPKSLFEATRPVEYLGPPVGLPTDKKSEKPLVPMVGSDLRNPIRVADDCVMPVKGMTAGKYGEVEFAQNSTDSRTPIVDDRDQSADGFQLLEIPPAPPANQSLETQQSIDVPVEEVGEIVILESSVTPNPDYRVPGEPPQVSTELLPFEFRTKNSERVETPVQSESTLLETFTANVLIDARPREVMKSSTSIRVEATEFESLMPTDEEPIKKIETKERTEFSFETSVDGEPVVERPAPFLFPEAKLKDAILDQVGSNIRELIDNKLESPDKREIKIRLKPEELGSVEITLVKSADGVIEAHFRTENPQTQQLLNETLAQLRESLENSGIKVGSLETSCGSTFAGPDGGGSSREENDGVNTQTHLRTTFDETVKVDEPGTNRLVNLRA